MSAGVVVVPGEGLLDLLGTAPSRHRRALWADVESGRIAPDDVRFVVIDRAGGPARRELLRTLPRVDVVQAMSVGIDYLDGCLPPNARVCNASPVISEQTAEHGFALALALLRRIPEYARLQDQGVWATLHDPAGPAVPRHALGTLVGARAAVLGFGTIGRSLARRLRAFGATVTAYARTARTEDGVTVRPIAEIADTVGEADVVLSALPLTSATDGLLDAAFFELLRPGAVFVNVGRGRSVDQSALVAAASAGRIRAGLDVVSPEPLPSEDPLFRTPGVLLTPHVAGDNGRILADLDEFVAAQVAGWERGEPLRAVVREAIVGAAA